MSRHLMTATNEFEAEIVLSRLSEAGIHAWESNNLGGPNGSAGARDIYVADGDLQQAARVLAEAQDVDVQGLTALAEQEAEPGEGVRGAGSGSSPAEPWSA